MRPGWSPIDFTSVFSVICNLVVAMSTSPHRYALNTRRVLRRLFPSPSWDLAVYGHAS